MNNKWVLEILWWIVTGIILVVVLYPIYHNLNAYPFWKSNIVFIVSFITLTRYIFLLPHTFLARRQILKIALVFLSIPAIFLLVQELNYFQTFLDEKGIEAVVGSLPVEERRTMVKYIRSEMLLFGVGSVISGVIFPFRMIMSVWRTRNRGTA
jgi:hypothetical protein